MPVKEIKKGVPARKGKPGLYRKYMILLLVLVPAAVYFNVFTLQYTCIDDTKFIVDNGIYNQDASNILKSFQRGLFNPADHSLYDYYRPVFLVDIIVEYHLFGSDPMGYHLASLLFHILSVLLLYVFFLKLKLKDTTSLVLALLFAVHPALSQTVAWIPGRNDLLLTIFLLASMIFAFNYAAKKKWVDYVLQLFFFFVAIFTKETAVIIPVLVTFILVFAMKKSWKSLLPLGIGWFTAIFFWFFMVSAVKESGNNIPVSEMVRSGISRIPAFPQYLGKIFFPVNLSVRPQIEETSLLWGGLAVMVIIGLLYYSRSALKPLTILGISWFLLFLLPVLAVPKIFNDQVYEHRLYVPVIGILLLLSQTFLFSEKFNDRYRFILFGMIIACFGMVSFSRVGYFKSPLAYWSRAVAESPRNAYSKQMMGTWVKDGAEQEKIMREARALDSTLQDINLNLGKIAFRNKRYDEAERLLKNELACTSAIVPDNFFLLGDIAFQKEDFGAAKKYLAEGLKISGNANSPALQLLARAYFSEKNFDSAAITLRKVVDLDPMNEAAYNNLVNVYLSLGQKDSVLVLVGKMKQKGLKPAPELLVLLEAKQR